jgi:hypothetical protein
LFLGEGIVGEQKVSVLRILATLAAVFVVLVFFATCRHSKNMSRLNDRTAAEAKRSLTRMFNIEELPTSVRGLECEGVDFICRRIARATCSLEIDAAEFEALFDQDEFREVSRRGRLSENLDDHIGPDFEIVREFRRGDEEEMWDLWVFTNQERNLVALNVVKDMHYDCD